MGKVIFMFQYSLNKMIKGSCIKLNFTDSGDNYKFMNGNRKDTNCKEDKWKIQSIR